MSSRFEFLGSLTLGQYIPRASWFHKRDPRSRLIAFVVLLVGVLFAPNLIGLAIAFVAISLIFFLGELPFKPAFKAIIRALPFIIILAILQILFSVHGGSERILWSLWGLDVTQADLNQAILLILRFMILISLLNALVMSISTSQISAALHHLFKPLERFGFPSNDITMVVQITLRFLPLVAQIAEKTAKAQASRGGDWEQKGFNPIRQAKRVVPLIVPLLIASLRRAETMAIAMESRGFNASDKRSSFYRFKFNWIDGLMLAIAIIMSALMILSGLLF